MKTIGKKILVGCMVACLAVGWVTPAYATEAPAETTTENTTGATTESTTEATTENTEGATTENTTETTTETTQTTPAETTTEDTTGATTESTTENTAGATTENTTETTTETTQTPPTETTTENTQTTPTETTTENEPINLIDSELYEDYVKLDPEYAAYLEGEKQACYKNGFFGVNWKGVKGAFTLTSLSHPNANKLYSDIFEPGEEVEMKFYRVDGITDPKAMSIVIKVGDDIIAGSIGTGKVTFTMPASHVKVEAVAGDEILKQPTVTSEEFARKLADGSIPRRTTTSTTNRNARPSVAPKTGDVAGLVPMGTLIASLIAFGFVAKKKRG